MDDVLYHRGELVEGIALFFKIFVWIINSADAWHEPALERWTRTGPTTLAYEVTVEDPTVWTQPWTVKQELSKQSDQENRIYTEPRCIEGNYGLPGLLHGRPWKRPLLRKGEVPILPP